MRSLLISCLLCVFPSQAFSTSVWVQGAKADDMSFRAIVEEKGETAIDQWLARHAPDPAAVKELEGEFVSAQKAFLSGSLSDARKQFDHITKKALAEDWGEPQREIIYFSYLRAAQLANSPDQKEAALNAALRFDVSREPDKAIFPPPLVSQFQALKSKAARFEWHLSSSANGFSIAIVNGKRVSIRGTVTLVAGPNRVTLLSAKYQPVTRVLEARELAKAEIPRIPWIEGTCDNPQWRMTKETFGPQVHYKAFLNEDCLIEPTLSLAEMARLSDSPSDKETGFSSLKSISEAKKPSKFWQSKWFWIGVAGVASAALVYQQSQNRSEPTRSTHEGF